jgi:hypothetical protein
MNCYRGIPWYPLVPVWCLFCGVIIPAIILPFFYYAIQISKDEASFTKYPPRLPNLLSILTGEEKAPRGFRYRINFWGDLVGIGWGLWVMQMWLFEQFQRSNMVEVFGVSFDAGFVFLALLSSMLLLYFLFAIYFAAILPECKALVETLMNINTEYRQCLYFCTPVTTVATVRLRPLYFMLQ